VAIALFSDIGVALLNCSLRHRCQYHLAKPHYAPAGSDQ
jgi:hypothetical protein